MPRQPNILAYTGTEPITLAEAKQYLRIDSTFTDDDAYITNLIPIARITVTKDTNQVVVKESIEEQFDNWQNGIIQLSYPGKLSEVAINYRKTIGTNIVMTADTDYVLGNVYVNSTLVRPPQPGKTFANIRYADRLPKIS